MNEFVLVVFKCKSYVLADKLIKQLKVKKKLKNFNNLNLEKQ